MSELVISVISVTKETKPTAKGSYDQLEIIYKNLTFQDKVEKKYVMSFMFKEVFNALSKATFGQTFYIDRVKNDKGYWDWTKASTTNEEQEQNSQEFGELQPMAAPTSNNPIKTATPSPKSTYETAEERAKRQIMIVRQSSISSAVALLAANGGKKNTTEEVLNVAREFENYVLNNEVIKKDPTDFSDLVDDVPF